MNNSSHDDCVKQEEWGKQKQINKSFYDHISDGKNWRIAIIGIIFAGIIQVVTFATIWGQLTTKVSYQEKINDSQDNKLDDLYRKVEYCATCNKNYK